MEILHPDDRRIGIHTRPEPTAATPMIDLTLRIRRRRSDILKDIGLGSRSGDIERGEVRLGQGGEDVVDVGRNVLGVLGVGEVDVLRARDEVGVEDDLAFGFEARGAVDVERDGAVARVAVVTRRADGALHARLGAVGPGDVVPKDGDFARERVRAGAGFEVLVPVGGDGVVVGVGVGLDGGAGEFDEGVGVVEELVADGGVVDPGGGGEAAELVGVGEPGEDGGVADAGFHQEFGGFQSAAAEDDSAGGG